LNASTSLIVGQVIDGEAAHDEFIGAVEYGQEAPGYRLGEMGDIQPVGDGPAVPSPGDDAATAVAADAVDPAIILARTPRGRLMRPREPALGQGNIGHALTFHARRTTGRRQRERAVTCRRTC
jgi:hypothetical protein